VVDKLVYSPFAEPGLLQLLRRRGIDSLVLTGLEADVCVLAAVWRGRSRLPVVIATMRCAASSDQAYDALLALYHLRFSQQIEVADADTILACWL